MDEEMTGKLWAGVAVPGSSRPIRLDLHSSGFCTGHSAERREFQALQDQKPSKGQPNPVDLHAASKTLTPGIACFIGTAQQISWRWMERSSLAKLALPRYAHSPLSKVCLVKTDARSSP